MRCRECESHLQSYLDGALDPGLTHAVRRHLGRCEACRGVLEEREVIPRRPALQLGDWVPPAGFVERTVRLAAESRDAFTGASCRPARPGRLWLLLVTIGIGMITLPGTRQGLARCGLGEPFRLAGALFLPFAAAPTEVTGRGPRSEPAAWAGERETAVTARLGIQTGLVDRMASSPMTVSASDAGHAVPTTAQASLASDQAILSNAVFWYAAAIDNLERAAFGRPDISAWLEQIRRGNASPTYSWYRSERGGGTGEPDWLRAVRHPEVPTSVTWVPSVELLGRYAAGRAGQDLAQGRRTDAARLLGTVAAMGARLRREGERDDERRAGAGIELTCLSLAQAAGLEPLPDYPATALSAAIRTAAGALAGPLKGEPILGFSRAEQWERLLALIGRIGLASLLLATAMGLAGLAHRLARRRWPGSPPLAMDRRQLAALCTVWLVPTLAAVLLLCGSISSGRPVTTAAVMAWLLPLSTLALTAYLAALGGAHARACGAPPWRLSAWIDHLIECPEPRLSPRWEFVGRAWLALDWRLSALGFALFLACGAVLAVLDQIALSGPPAWL